MISDQGSRCLPRVAVIARWLKRHSPAVAIMAFTAVVIGCENGLLGKVNKPFFEGSVESGWPFVAYRYHLRREIIIKDGGILLPSKFYGKAFETEEYVWPAIWANALIGVVLVTAAGLSVEFLGRPRAT